MLLRYEIVNFSQTDWGANDDQRIPNITGGEGLLSGKFNAPAVCDGYFRDWTWHGRQIVGLTEAENKYRTASCCQSQTTSYHFCMRLGNFIPDAPDSELPTLSLEAINPLSDRPDAVRHQRRRIGGKPHDTDDAPQYCMAPMRLALMIMLANPKDDGISLEDPTPHEQAPVDATPSGCLVVVPSDSLVGRIFPSPQNTEWITRPYTGTSLDLLPRASVPEDPIQKIKMYSWDEFCKLFPEPKQPKQDSFQNCIALLEDGGDAFYPS